ncbi:acyl-CoA dehydrogenase family protein [Sciscionella marina]|uniref:acyl-CoA dehydrogenase family protein n=1 Tax=Sciscionella marina TaxID=508770 RepID=UPI00037D0774|nr:acyl-CoA dehydrogenase family protein [Sciscionella marina]
MFELTEERRDLSDLAARVAADRFASKARQWDENRTFFPVEERRKLGELGLLGLTLPEEYGGGGRPLLDALLVIEELAKVNPLSGWPVFEASAGPARVIHLFGTEEQRGRILPAVASGDITIAVSISEPDAGSAATDVATSACVEGDEVVINGTKRWCSGAGHAEKYLVYVRFGTDAGAAGMGAVLVDKEAAGLTFGPQEHLMGHRGVGSADMFFDNVRVPVRDIIVDKGGFRKLFTAFSIERLGNSTMSLAIGQASLDRTAQYVQERRQFGKEIAEFQLVQAGLADMVMQVRAARMLVYQAAASAGTGAPSALDASVAKCFANEMAKQVSDMAMQLHGGYGYSAEYEVERLHRDAHGWALAGGTPAIQRSRITAEYLGRRFNQRG